MSYGLGKALQGVAQGMDKIEARGDREAERDYLKQSRGLQIDTAKQGLSDAQFNRGVKEEQVRRDEE